MGLKGVRRVQGLGFRVIGFNSAQRPGFRAVAPNPAQVGEGFAE